MIKYAPLIDFLYLIGRNEDRGNNLSHRFLLEDPGNQKTRPFRPQFYSRKNLRLRAFLNS